MQELEKILEEIKAHAIEFEVFGTSDDYISVGWVNDIIRRHMKNEEDILKFYYCESEDDYYLGQRVQNMYYARYADGVFTWFMSRHLPWGKRVTAPETTWKEYTYPTEPKEIPFTEWLDGFIRKHMNDGWIPVEERLPEEKVSPESQDFYEYQVTANFGFGESVRTYKYGNGHWWHGPGIVDEYVVAWREHPEPYRPERGGGRMKYKCANEFYIEIYDETWMPTGEYKTIPAGTIWELDESTNNIGGEVHLDNDDEGWIEISRDTFEECFEEVRE